LFHLIFSFNNFCFSFLLRRWHSIFAILDPLKVQKITAKRLLRKAQRQAYASSRNRWARKIMGASTTDTKLFHTLINKQRGLLLPQHFWLVQFKLFFFRDVQLYCFGLYRGDTFHSKNFEPVLKKIKIAEIPQIIEE
jgi:hypothetical protein